MQSLPSEPVPAAVRRSEFRVFAPAIKSDQRRLFKPIESSRVGKGRCQLFSANRLTRQRQANAFDQKIALPPHACKMGELFSFSNSLIPTVT